MLASFINKVSNRNQRTSGEGVVKESGGGSGGGGGHYSLTEIRRGIH